MNSLFTRFLILFIFTLSAHLSFSQSNELQIRFIGNCGLYLTDGSTNIYIDFPYKSGAHNYMEYDISELDSIRKDPIFIYTHKHADHYSGKLVKKSAQTRNGQIYGPWNIKKMLELSGKIPNFTIETFKTKHRFSFNHYSYLISWHGKRIFFSGDTEHPHTIALMSDLDWAFAPAWLVTEAFDQNLKIDSEKIAIYHIGPKDHITSSDPKIVLLNTQGEIIRIPY